nr:MAG TPA: hypothetical protein [Caudoviricetes sp.]
MKLMDYVRSRAKADTAKAQAEAQSAREREQMAEALQTLGVETEDSDEK